MTNEGQCITLVFYTIKITKAFASFPTGPNHTIVPGERWATANRTERKYYRPAPGVVHGNGRAHNRGFKHCLRNAKLALPFEWRG
jgi:hypothetical protein